MACSMLFAWPFNHDHHVFGNVAELSRVVHPPLVVFGVRIDQIGPTRLELQVLLSMPDGGTCQPQTYEEREDRESHNRDGCHTQHPFHRGRLSFFLSGARHEKSLEDTSYVFQ